MVYWALLLKNVLFYYICFCLLPGLSKNRKLSDWKFRQNGYRQKVHIGFKTIPSKSKNVYKSLLPFLIFFRPLFSAAVLGPP